MKILFLTNNSNTEKLINRLRESEEVVVFSERITLNKIRKIKPEFVISYNYVYLIGKDVIDFMKKQIINLHTSLLPWNKGRYPNVWQIIDNTPCGVSIHQLTLGLDEGAVLVQREMNFEDSETLKSSYEMLQEAIQRLLLDNWELIKDNKLEAKEQIGVGSKHTARETDLYLNLINYNWEMTIREFKKIVQCVREEEESE